MSEHDATHWLGAIGREETSCEELMASSLDRIESRNGELNAVVSLRERGELMDEARRADAVAKEERGRLHGLPFAVKDLAETAGIRTTFGSPSFQDNVPTRDGALARRVRSAGAILIGKTNTPEWGFGSHTFNPVFGATRNPFDPSRSAGGSSGGAGCALRTGMVPLADGSDMMGSLRNPAVWNGVYGFRPTWGLVSGDVPEGPRGGDTFMHQLSTEGPMARSPRDLALLLDVLAEPDRRHPFAPDAPTTFARDLAPHAPKIGWWADMGGHLPVEDAVMATCEAGLERWRRTGATVKPFRLDFDMEKVWRSWLVLRQFATVGRLEAVYRNDAMREAMKADAVWEIEAGLALSIHDVLEATNVRSAFHARFVEAMDGLDGVALPAAQLLPFPVDWTWPREVAGREMDTYHRWMECVVPASLLGLPTLAFAMGLPDGLPAGIQVMGRKGEDARVLGIAEHWHREFGLV